MDRYANISDHRLIGDLHAAALVTTDGTIDWFCSPRIDSPGIFASLLDAESASPTAWPDGRAPSPGARLTPALK